MGMELLHVCKEATQKCINDLGVIGRLLGRELAEQWRSFWMERATNRILVLFTTPCIREVFSRDISGLIHDVISECDICRTDLQD